MKEVPRGGTIGVAVGDYDQDGWPDIFVHGRYRANKLYHNLETGPSWTSPGKRESWVTGSRTDSWRWPPTWTATGTWIS